MPRVRTLRTKRSPEGWELIEPTLTEMMNQMRDAENEPHEGKRKIEATWKIMRLHHQRTRYVYDLRYKKKEISKDLYEWLLRERWADATLIAKWKKSGYEKLCCILCIQPKDTNFHSTCICRVPKGQLQDGK